MKVMLIDGNSLTYRAFFALPTDITLASGQVTNAVYGFTSMLVNLVTEHRPDAIGVAFDLPQPTFRHERVETYKANRSAAPDILRDEITVEDDYFTEPWRYSYTFRRMPGYKLLEYVCEDNRDYVDENGHVTLRIDEGG